MPPSLAGVSPHTLTLDRQDLREMILLARLLYQLSKRPAYYGTLKNSIPISAQFNPVNDSVLMGYDFHLSETGPKLIEVNNNAGGLWLAWQAHHPDNVRFNGKLAHHLVTMFFNEYALWRGQKNARPRTLAIIDESPQTQFLYPEMRAIAELLNAHNVRTFILDPSELTANGSGLNFQGTPIDVVYNRHCDFYLQTAALTTLGKAWLARQVCLTPNPHTYALLSDKQRMIDWSSPARVANFGISLQAQKRLANGIPCTRLLATQNREQLWQERKQWVFKPTTAYASRGVYAGNKLTTRKFSELPPATTLVQHVVKPSIYKSPDGQLFKTDFRLFMYQQRILSVAARIYQGQVTNLRTEKGGFARVSIQ